MEDLARYLDEIVEPTVKDFEAYPTSVRHAFLACVAVFHSVDYLAFPKKPAALRQRFNKDSEAFALIDKVAHAFKHMTTGKRSNPDLRASDVITRPPAFWDVMVWDLSRWDDAVGGVTLDTDRNIDLLTAIRSTVDFLREKTTQEK